MKNYFFLLSCTVIASSCSVPLHIVDKKPTQKFFSKILTIYVNDPYDFSLLDSTLYNIAITGYFTEPDKLKTRVGAEDILSGSLSSDHTEIIGCSDVFQRETYSYRSLKSLIDNFGIDAILVLDITARNHTPTSVYDFTMIGRYTVMGRHTAITSNARFECYLIDAKANRVVWMANAEIKGNRNRSELSLARAMVHSIHKSLVNGLYIAGD